MARVIHRQIFTYKKEERLLYAYYSFFILLPINKNQSENMES